VIMADPNTVKNLGAAIAKREHPAITRWNRLEGRPRTHDFDRALKAEVRDALWMLTRQWQMGEFQGDDAGSPVKARACIDVYSIDAFQSKQGPVQSLDLKDPFEAQVECRSLPLRGGDQYLSLDIRLLVGRRWLKLLKREQDAGSLSNDYRTRKKKRMRLSVRMPTRGKWLAPQLRAPWTGLHSSNMSPSLAILPLMASARLWATRPH
jgi:hypothetical protein